MTKNELKLEEGNMTMSTKESAESKCLLRATAGVYILYFIAGFPLLLRSSLIVPANAVATAAKIASSETLYRITMVTDLVSYALYLGLAYLFYLLLRHVNRPWALLG